jgi:hypothetical protein
MPAFTVVLVLVAHASRGYQRTAQIRGYRVGGFSAGPGYYLDASFIEYIDGPAAHPAGNDDVYAQVGQIVGKEPGLCPDFLLKRCLIFCRFPFQKY